MENFYKNDCRKWHFYLEFAVISRTPTSIKRHRNIRYIVYTLQCEEKHVQAFVFGSNHLQWFLCCRLVNIKNQPVKPGGKQIINYIEYILYIRSIAHIRIAWQFKMSYTNKLGHALLCPMWLFHIFLWLHLCKVIVCIYLVTFSPISIQQNLICIEPKHKMHYLKALYQKIIEKPNSSSNEQAVTLVLISSCLHIDYKVSNCKEQQYADKKK